jgi:hypothetical protein
VSEQWPEIVTPNDKKWWLTPDQKMICDYYLGECQFDQRCAIKKVREYKNNNTADAAASRFFKLPRVARYISLRSKQLTKELEITQEDIIKDLIEVKEMAMGRKPSHVYATDKDGNIYPDYVHVVNLSVAKQTLEQLGKYHKVAMWSEKQEKEINSVVFNFNMAAPEEKPKIVEGMTINIGENNDG